MTVQEFIHRRYSPAVGESAVGHVVAIVAGLALTAIGGALVMSIAFVQPGLAIGILGMLILGAGLFAHITSPLRCADLLDTVVGLSGAAITLTLVIAIVTFLVGFGVTVFVSLFRWLAS